MNYGLVARLLHCTVRLLNKLPPVTGSIALQAAPAQAALLNLHRALEFPELWESLQGLLEAIVPHDTLVMSVNYLDWRREAVTKRLSSVRSRRPHGDEADRLVAAEGRGFFQPFLDANQGITAYRHSQIISNPQRIVAMPYYRGYMQHYDWRYSAHLLFWQGKGIETSFALRRRADQGDFTPAEMDVLNAVHPHIKVSFDRMRTFEQERQRRRLLEGFYRAKPEAVLFLDWNLASIYVSQDALALCAAWNLGAEKARSYSPQAVFSVPDEIRAACESLKAGLNAQSHDAAKPPPTQMVKSARSGYEALVTFRREKGSALTKPVFVVRLRPGENSPGAESVTLGDGPEQSRLLHQLTPVERELVSLVCAGLTNKEIAQQLNKTEGSVKVQLSGVFQKLRVHSRTQLVVALR